MHLLVLLTVALLAPPADVTAPGATLTRLAGGFAFTEGPTADAQGNVYFTDQPNDKILVWSVDGGLSTFLSPSGRANGLCFDKDGQLWACADLRNEVWRIDPQTKAVTVVLKHTAGDGLLNGPNDLWVRSDGCGYLTDPYYARPWWTDRPKTKGPQGLYLLSADHQTLKLVDREMKCPNGLIGTPDGRRLYVSDLNGGQTWVYDLAADGTPSGKRLFCKQGSDGLTLDDEGHVYLTGKGVSVYSPDGALVQQIAVPGEGWTANVCIGGRDRRTLFVTASRGLYAIALRTRGVGSQ